jgi:glutaredoxin 3
MNKIIVKLYTTPACPYCFTLSEFLKENRVEFEEIDVSQDEKARDDMVKKSGQMGAPVLEIGGEVIVGFDKAKITKLLGLKK